MAEIGLRTYLRQIDGLIEQKQLDEAVAHCKHILSHHPKSLETYRLLGKALLEKGRHGDASDIFQRVLSAVPDDFVAHVGMSLVREDEANLEAALWHMERAFESNPANTAIQEELRRLYGRRDGLVPVRARLTRGALARLYLRGGLYPQAEAELRAALQEDPERLDLIGLLAHVLLESGHRAEAADLCAVILQKLPYSQDGNRILADILKSQNRADDAKACRQRLEALDPYEAYADGHGAQIVRDDVVRLPEMPATQEQFGAAAEPPEWATSLGETLDVPFAQPADAGADEEPEWLKGGTGMLTAEPTPITGALDLPAAGEVPDWLKDVQPVEAPPPELPDWMKVTTGMLADTPQDPDQPPKKKTGNLADWLKPSEEAAGAEAAPLAAAEVPDWMKDIAPPQAEASAATGAADSVETQAFGWPSTGAQDDESGTMRLDEIPEWMKAAPEPGTPAAWMTGKLGAESAPDETMPLSDLPAAELPEWMKAASPDVELPPPPWMQPGAASDETTALGTGQLDDLPPAELPEWMKAAGAAAAAELPPWMQAGEAGAGPQAAASTDEIPDWLKAAESTEALPEWMQAAEPAAPAKAPSPPPPQPAVELPDFLQPASREAIERANQPMELEEEEPEPAAAQSDESGVPDWIKAMAPDLSAAPPPPAEEAGLPPVAPDELPDWLKPTAAAGAGLAAGAALVGASLASAEEAAAPEPPEAEPASDLPDWLKAVAASPEPSLAEAPAPPLADLGSGAAGAPDLASMDADDAMRWLEGLAAHHTLSGGSAAGGAQGGAAPEELITPPKERTDALPAWLAAEATEAEPVAGAAEAAASATPPDELPDWLKAMATEGEAGEPIGAPEAGPAPAGATTPLPEAGAAEAGLPDLSAMDADEAMRWLEGLAARQGAAPEELITKPEERIETPPAWLAAEAPAEAPIEASTVRTPEWLSAPSQEEELPLPPADLPAWAQTTEPGASDTIATWLSDKNVPDWLRKPGEAPAPPPSAWLRAPIEPEEAEPPQGQPALPDWLQGPAAVPPPEAAPAEAGVPDLSAMDADEAMRWLEGLAARQGAAPEELITKPEERTEAPPTWIAAESAAPAEAEAPTPSEELPDWFKAMQAEPPPPAETPPTFEPVAPAAVEGALPSETAPAEAGGPDLGAMEADEAMRWLEGLAARQGAAPEELITTPEERIETPPEWMAGAEHPGPIMPPTGILPDVFQVGAMAVPEILAAAEVPAEPLPQEAAPGAAPAEAGGPDLGAMDADEAMRWLEGLAARQGAAPEELITRPDERVEAPPAWVAAESAAPAPAPEAEERPLGTQPDERTTAVPAWIAGYQAEPEPVGEVPDWLKAMRETPAPAEEVEEAPRPATDVSTTPPAPAAAPAPAAEEPAPEPTSGLPDWIKAMAGSEAVAPAAAPAEELPDWIKAPVPPAAPEPAPAPPVEQAETGDDRLARLAEKLAASRRGKDADIAARFEQQRAEREAAQRDIAQKMEERRTRQTSGTGPLRPGTGPLRGGTEVLKPPAEAEVAPTTPPAGPPPAQPAEVARPAPAATGPIPVPARLGRSRKTRKAKSPYAGQEPADLLHLSRQRLTEGDLNGAADSLGYLVSTGHAVPEVILELETATSSYTGATALYRVLGDAYMKSNQLQKALDAYRLALAQL